MFSKCCCGYSRSLSDTRRLSVSLGVLVSLPLVPWVAAMSGCGTSIGAQSQNYDAATATAKAMETYDRNADGQLSSEELQNCPALASQSRRIDRNHDGMLAAEEIRSHIEALDGQSDYIGLDVLVTAKGRPLVGAQLTLTPEPFMGEDLQAYSGTTVEGGGCPLKGEKAQLPGIPIGFYQVRVVDADQGIDEVRGCEIADDTTGNRLQIAL